MLCRPNVDKKEMTALVASQLQSMRNIQTQSTDYSVQITPEKIDQAKVARDVVNLYLDVLDEFVNHFIAEEDAINRKYYLKAAKWPALSVALGLASASLVASLTYEASYYHGQHQFPCNHHDDTNSTRYAEMNATANEGYSCDMEFGLYAGAVVSGVVLGVVSVATMLFTISQCSQDLKNFPAELPEYAEDNYNQIAKMVNACFLENQNACKVDILDENEEFNTRHEYYQALLVLKNAIKQAHKNFSSKHSSTEQPHGRFFSVRGRMNDEKIIEIANAILSPEKQGQKYHKKH